MEKRSREIELLKELNFWSETDRTIEVLNEKMMTPTGSLRQEQFRVEGEVISGLLVKASGVWKVGFQEVLLYAAAKALEAQLQTSTLPVLLEYFGRDILDEDVDLTHTVGWFTDTYPVILDLGDLMPDEALSRIQRVLRSVPNRGRNYGILRWLSNYHVIHHEPLISFNFMTNTEKRITEKKQFRVCTNEMDTGRNSYAQNHRPQKFSIDCTVAQGELSVYFEYDDQFLKSGFAFQRKFQEILNLMIEDDEPRKADVGFAVPQRYFTTSERAELYQAVQAYQNNKENSQIECQYVPAQYQNAFLLVRNNMVVGSVVAPAVATMDEVKQAMLEEVALQDVLRSTCNTGTNLSQRIVVYSSHPFWDIPVIAYNEYFANDLEMMPGLFADGHFLVFLALMQDHQDRIHVVFAAQHSVWDKTSIDILQNRLNQHFLSPEEMKIPPTHYYDYVMDATGQKKMGEESHAAEKDSTEEVFLSVVRKWKRQLVSTQEERSRRIWYKLAPRQKELFLRDPLYYGLLVFLLGLFGNREKISALGVIPVTVLHHGRSRENYSVLGLYVNIVPLLVDTKNMVSGHGNISGQVVDVVEESGASSRFSHQASAELVQYFEIIPNLNYVGVLPEEKEVAHMTKGEVKTLEFERYGFDVIIRLLEDVVEFTVPCNPGNEKAQIQGMLEAFKEV